AVLVAVATGVLAVRRRWPIPVLVVAAGAALTMHLLGYPDSGVPFAVVIALYTVGAHCERRITVALTVALVVLVPVVF
ncbi:DUF7134 domain-containing protein, partial [Stenotrophomonas maltophilia]|uniref:DUF7134 domain-containing protein n=1 Tax=Stenotrophomonas maltophilia TaxID=40324 RepID=UPI001EF9AEE6